MIKVKYRGNLASLTGIAEESLEARDVRAVIKSIRRRYGPEAGKAARAMLIALNGESILLLNRYRTALKEGDVLSFFPIAAGG